MKIRLTQPGMENFNGQFGAFDFKDGLSVQDVNPIEAAGIMACVTAETVGEHEAMPLPEVNLPTMGESKVAVRPGVPEPVQPVAGKVYTRAQLEEIADKGGINGLRAVAPAGAKATSVVALIDKILAAQPQAKPETVDTPVVTDPVAPETAAAPDAQPGQAPAEQAAPEVTVATPTAPETAAE